MAANDLFLGTWVLVPELCMYEAGVAPARGTYDIREAGDRLEFSITWTTEPGGPEIATAFGGPFDGSVQALPVPEGAPAGTPDGLTITRIDRRTLDSEALLGRRVLAYARRVASSDGSLLAVVQEVRLPEGRGPRNFQVYRRA